MRPRLTTAIVQPPYSVGRRAELRRWASGMLQHSAPAHSRGAPGGGGVGAAAMPHVALESRAASHLPRPKGKDQ